MWCLMLLLRNVTGDVVVDCAVDEGGWGERVC